MAIRESVETSGGTSKKKIDRNLYSRPADGSFQTEQSNLQKSELSQISHCAFASVDKILEAINLTQFKINKFPIE